VRRIISLTLAASLLSLSLAGCGAPATPLTGAAPGRTKASGVQAQTLTADQMAQQFANQLALRGGDRPRVRGAVVTVATAGGPDATYDFTETPRTGMVTFRAGEFETTFKYSAKDGEINGKAVPAILVAIAVKMVWGGTVAFAKYWLTHRGDEFNRKDCVKAVVYGMVSEGLTAIPGIGGALSHFLWPIAWKWVDKWIDKNWPWDPRKMLDLGLSFTDEVVGALQEAQESSQL
jgi:hypothetical protein